MIQETGETRDAIIEDDNKLITKIVEANKHKTDPYWIILYAKHSTQTLDGKLVLKKYIKALGDRPPSMVGAVLGRVDNSKGSITWEVNMPQVPFDFDKLSLYGAKPGNEVVTETTSIPWAYATQ
mgnify:CR=1 FL=1